MDKEFIENKKRTFSKGSIEYVNMAGIRPDIMEERHIRFVMPVDPLHLNHVGTAYAGSIFTMAEIARGNLFSCTYGQDYVPVLKAVEVRYLKPTKHDLVVDIALTEEEAAEKIQLAAERGRGDYFLDISVMDSEGVQVAEAHFNYYAFTAEKIKEFGSGK